MLFCLNNKKLAVLACVSGLLGLGGCGGGGSSPSSDSVPNSETIATPVGAKVKLSKQYFVAGPGDHWVFDKHQGGASVGVVTRTVISGPDAVGELTIREVDDGFVNDTQLQSRAEGLFVKDPLEARDQFPGLYDALPEVLSYSYGDNTAGQTRTINKSGGLAVDVDADGKVDQFRVTLNQIFRGMTQIVVMGTTTDVAFFTNTTLLEVSYSKSGNKVSMTFTEDEYYASNLGLVRTTRSATRSDGFVLTPTYTLNLRSSFVGGMSRGLASTVLDRNLIEVAASTRDPSPLPIESVIVTTIDPTGRNGLFVKPTFTNNAIASVTPVILSPDKTRLDIQFVSVSSKAPGKYIDNLTVQVCYDSDCSVQANGSPGSVMVQMSVSNTPLNEQGMAPLPVQSRLALTHNVIDAEYSKSLDSIVMASAWPENALYIYDTASGFEKKVSLKIVPTAISVSPDGLTAAVGHDGKITWVDLKSVQSGAPITKLLDTSTKVFDLVLDGAGYVHVMPAADQWESLHSVKVATNTESLIGWSLYAGSRGKLHPSQNALYTADNGLSPSDIAKWSLNNGVATYVGDSPYHGDFSMCGDIWFSEDGAVIYTACGNTFKASTVPEQDMRYSGALKLSTGNSGYRITSLSQSSIAKEVALIEQDWWGCSDGPASNCYDHVRLYGSEFLGLNVSYGLPSLTVAGTQYSQRGVSVFHSANGKKLFVITRLAEMPNPAAEYYITTVR